jgi:GNAT superfamily N-acetyltransferase
MAMTIRRAGPADHEAWLSLWRGYQAFYEADLSADEERLWKALMEPGPDGPFALLAIDGTGKAVGLAQYLFHITTWSPKKRCYLNDLYTAPDARGKGVASALIGAVSKIAEEKGAGQVWWLTQEFNHTARRLYDKLAERTPFIKYAR